jgi:hypothetical protein
MEKTLDPQIKQEMAKEARRAYYREYKRRNKEKIAQQQESYWYKRALAAGMNPEDFE